MKRSNEKILQQIVFGNLPTTLAIARRCDANVIIENHKKECNLIIRKMREVLMNNRRDCGDECDLQ